MESPVRDLARKLSALAAGHIAFPQVAAFMHHVDSHLSAIAFAEEAARRHGEIEVRLVAVEKTVAYLCPDKSSDV